MLATGALYAPERQALTENLEAAFPGQAPLDSDILYIALLHVKGNLAAHGFLCAPHTLRFGYVHPNFRGHGLQQRLIQVRVLQARSLGLPRVDAWVLPQNLPSQRNLAACGFKPTRETRTFSGKEHHRHVLHF